MSLALTYLLQALGHREHSSGFPWITFLEKKPVWAFRRIFFRVKSFSEKSVLRTIHSAKNPRWKIHRSTGFQPTVLPSLGAHLSKPPDWYWWACRSSGCVESKSYIKPKVNVSWSAASSVFNKFPTFNLQTWKHTTFMGLWQAHWASRLCQIEKFYKTKNECFWVTFKFCFIHDPPIPNFYLANLDMDPFLMLLTSP